MIVRPSFLIIIGVIVSTTMYSGRSPFRLPDPKTPKLEIRWFDGGDSQELYTLTSPHLEEYPIFGIFNRSYFENHLLPSDAITFRNQPEKFASGEHLSALIEELLIEIMTKQREYSHFTLLQKKDFSRRGSCGLIVLKFNDYPFVVKLFLETPQSFSKPSGKGIEQMFFFYMGGGVNRHLTGFTRLRNLELIKERLAQSPEWSSMVDTPRKWFWLPRQSKWLHVTGYGLGNKQRQEITIPGVYAIIADAITPSRNLSLMEREDRKLALRLYNFLQSSVDPHIKNYMIEEETGKLVIIDTEYFPALVGFKDSQEFDSYLAWCWHLIDKCAKDMFWLTKRERRQRQTAQRSAILG